MNKRLNLIISGKVQGVFFRHNTQKLAKQLNLTGWVKNNKDGCVELIAEGEESQLKQLLEFCKQGPLGAEVKDTKQKWSEYKKEFREFKRKY